MRYSGKVLLAARKKTAIRRPMHAQVSIPQLDGEKLLARVAEVLDYPLSSINPRVVYAGPRTAARMAANKNPGAHNVLLNSTVFVNPKVDSEVRSHELIHSVNGLLESNWERKRLRPGVRQLLHLLPFSPSPLKGQLYSEVAAELASPRYKGSSKETAVALKSEAIIDGFFEAYFLSLLASPVVGVPYYGARLISRFGSMALRNRAVRELYSRHGQDALILFFAYPPRIFGHFSLKRWENRMVHRGFLKPDGGFTEKGILFMRKIRSRKFIDNRLKQFEQARAKSGWEKRRQR